MSASAVNLRFCVRKVVVGALASIAIAAGGTMAIETTNKRPR